VAMMGRLGYDLDVSKMTEKELAFSQQALKDYRRLSNTIGQGDLYRLLAPYDGERASLMYVDKDKKKAVLFGYVLHPRYGSNWAPVKLQGLDAGKTYRVKEINKYPGTKTELAGDGKTLIEDGKAFTGEYLMKAGLSILGKKELTSTVVEITEE
jgi:alpha-galactosidase